LLEIWRNCAAVASQDAQDAEMTADVERAVSGRAVLAANGITADGTSGMPGRMVRLPIHRSPPNVLMMTELQSRRVQRLLKMPQADRLRRIWGDYGLLMKVVEDERWPVFVRSHQLNFLQREESIVRDAVLLTIVLRGILRLAGHMHRTGEGRDGSYVEAWFDPPDLEEHPEESSVMMWWPVVYTNFEPPEASRWQIPSAPDNEFSRSFWLEVVPLVERRLRFHFDFAPFGTDAEGGVMFALRPGRWPRLLAGVERHPALNWRQMHEADGELPNSSSPVEESD
jgi:hypothetical protein